jgi:hypothetical protein
MRKDNIKDELEEIGYGDIKCVEVSQNIVKLPHFCCCAAAAGDDDDNDGLRF